MPKLIVAGPSGDIPHELSDDTITIGRAPDNAIRIDDVSVSSRHAELSFAGESCYLKDLDSTNGTRVNGETITRVQLRAGDKIRFGKVEACYEREVTGSAQPLPLSTEVEARPAESSARPADFANASPFPNRKKEKDPTRTAVLAAAAVAVVAFFVSMLALLMMHAPGIRGATALRRRLCSLRRSCICKRRQSGVATRRCSSWLAQLLRICPGISQRS